MTNFRRYCEAAVLIAIGLAFPLVLIAGEALRIAGCAVRDALWRKRWVE